MMDIMLAGASMLRKLHMKEALQNAGLWDFAWRVRMRKTMKQAYEYFSQNADIIKANAEKLSDKTSRDVYLNAIRYRYSYSKATRPEISTEKQYFIRPVALLLNHEKYIFVDCGAYNGDTIEVFLNVVPTGGGYEKIYAYEPDPANFAALQKKYSGRDDIKPINAGVWSEKTTLSFTSGNGNSSKIVDGNSEAETDHVNVDCIDNLSLSGNIMIAMDIEGAERHALDGAKNTIEKNRPILAISIYHSDEDLVILPQRMISMFENRDYDFYCRNHENGIADTVFYCVPKNSGQKS